ncbi:MAG: S66 peptidase family protein [Actinomycetota bacterium]
MARKSPIPEFLAPGDKIAVVSPSFGALGAWPHRAEKGLAYLHSLGLEVEVMPNARRNDSWVSASAEERADDLHRAFADPDVKLILCGIGGNHTNQVLTHLDFDLIGSNPKWLQGYSDITVLQYALMKRCGMPSFYGPALVSEMGEHPEVLAYTDRWLRAAWFGTEPLKFEPTESWTEEFLDWDTQEDLQRPRKMEPSEGWVTINEGSATGPVVGGCLETICWHLKGQADWVQPEEALFFFETSEEVPSPAHVDAYLTDLEQLGVFGSCAGLLVGRPRGYSAEERSALWELVARYARRYSLPALGNIDCAHTDPMLTLPLGVSAALDASGRSLVIDLSGP